MRGAAESEPAGEELKGTILEQVGRMDQTVDYQLRRAAAHGRTPLRKPLAVEPCLQRIARSLAKVHADRALTLAVDAEERAVFFGDEGDLAEIVANLGDNACKWARSEVCLRARESSGAKGDGKLLLEVEDDGPGFPRTEIERALRRGARLDHNTEGHGIGLAIVHDLVVSVYGGELRFDIGSLGGTQVRVLLKRDQSPF